MTAFFLKEQPYLVKERVNNLIFPELTLCPLCEGVLWLPIACWECDKAYCSACITTRQKETPDATHCPNNCAKFVMRPCPPTISHILKTLQVTCRYKLYGCLETLPYNDLETHEKTCDYQLISCTGCDQRIIQKDFQEHDSTCPLVLLTCKECVNVYKRGDQAEHTELTCLRIQLDQIRDQMNQNERQYNDKFSALENQVNDLSNIVRQFRI